jgi:hypothetical protein
VKYTQKTIPESAMHSHLHTHTRAHAHTHTRTRTHTPHPPRPSSTPPNVQPTPSSHIPRCSARTPPPCYSAPEAKWHHSVSVGVRLQCEHVNMFISQRTYFRSTKYLNIIFVKVVTSNVSAPMGSCRARKARLAVIFVFLLIPPRQELSRSTRRWCRA